MNEDRIIKQNGYKNSEASYYETLFCLSNGVFGVRPTLDFNSEFSRPGFFASGIYDFALSVENQIINLPNFTDISIFINGEILCFDLTEPEPFYRYLDLNESILYTKYCQVTSDGIKIAIEREEFLDKENRFCNRLYLIPEEDVCVRAEYCINYSIGNNYHGGYVNQFIKSHHVQLEDFEMSKKSMFLKFSTVKDKKNIYYNMSLDSGSEAKICRGLKRIGLCSESQVNANQKYEISNIVCVGFEIKKEFDLTDFNLLKERHKREFTKKWGSFEKVKFTDELLNESMAYSIYQLECAYSSKLPNGTNIPARGLSSEYHHGHFFFNTELYMVLYYAIINPVYARSLLFYRVNTLEQAIKNARLRNKEGAFWSEESDIYGCPAGPEVVKDFLNKEEFTEYTGEKVQHIGADVVFSCFKYIKITDDYHFEKEITDMVINISKYYLSIVDCEESVYSINNVIGPDEYHIGVNNNYYTNAMVKFCLKFTQELIVKYNVDESLQFMNKLEKVIINLSEPKIKNNVIEQFDGYFDLEDYENDTFLDNGLPKVSKVLENDIFKFGNINSQIVKQSDVIMFLSLLPEKFSKHVLEASLEYYEKRTIHESSLSTTHAGIVAAYVGDQDLAKKYMMLSSGFNLNFEPKEFYNNGIHYAANAGAWMILFYGIFGISERDGLLSMNKLTESILDLIEEIKFTFWFRNTGFTYHINKDIVKIISNNELSFKMYLGSNIVSSGTNAEITYTIG